MTIATDQNSDNFSPNARQFLSIRDTVMDRWELEVRSRIQGAQGLLSPVLADTLPAFYDNIAEALSSAHPRKDATSDNNAAALHGDERARMTSYGPGQVVHEYQIFREVIALVAKENFTLSDVDWAIIDRSINAATREAIDAFTARQDALRHTVAAALSHDMRTPLGVIVNGAQLIGITPEMDIDLARKVATKIESSAKRLEDMMSDLLDALTQQSNPKSLLHLSEFDINRLVQEARDQYCQAGESIIKIVQPERSIVGYWCWNSLRRALENLINNAIKYGDGRGISLTASETRGRLILSVHNGGNPIPKELHKSIFDYLRREPNAPGPGWGIGLQYVKTVAEGHGGSALVDSSAETGTTFLIDIPLDCRPFVAVPDT